jgi:fatty acid desaturase
MDVMDRERTIPAEPDWYKIPVDRRKLKALQARTDLHGLALFGLWVIGLAAFGWLAVAFFSWWLTVIFYFVYANIFAFSGAILHETNHRTAFRTSWLNETVHFIAGLAEFKDPIRDRWLHALHHTYTAYRDVDVELHASRPPRLTDAIFFDFLSIKPTLMSVKSMFLNAIGRDPLTALFVPASEQRKVVWSSRACLAFYASVIGVAIGLQSWWPILFVFAARLIGQPYIHFLVFVEHAGLNEEVPDWRQNTRTTHVSLISRLLFWNMNYHLEHHMYPTVPFHALPHLEKEIEPLAPTPYESTLEAWREMIPALLRQRKDPSHYIQRIVP